jgi:hypothetical protein
VLFKPYIGVDVGPFNFNFDLGGLTFNLRPDIDINFNFGSGGGTPLPPGVQPRPPLPPAEGGECDLSGVISLVSATRSELAQRITEQTGILQPQEAPLVWTQLTAPADSGMAQLPLNSVAVRFEMTDRPFNKKAMSGNGGSPDVTYAGWALFGGANVDGGERIPLDYESTRIYVPPNATHVGWTCKDGRRASVSVGVFQPTDANLKLGRNLLWQAKI